MLGKSGALEKERKLYGGEHGGAAGLAGPVTSVRGVAGSVAGGGPGTSSSSSGGHS